MLGIKMRSEDIENLVRAWPRDVNMKNVTIRRSTQL